MGFTRGVGRYGIWVRGSDVTMEIGSLTLPCRVDTTMCQCDLDIDIVDMVVGSKEGGGGPKVRPIMSVVRHL